jgi:FHS family glucose/mannose:H+ symporter-like MFS transporter
VPGGVIAFYQLGYGIAAFGAGPLQDAGVGLSAIFGCTAVAAVVMGGLSFALAAREPARTSAPR